MARDQSHTEICVMNNLLNSFFSDRKDSSPNLFRQLGIARVNIAEYTNSEIHPEKEVARCRV